MARYLVRRLFFGLVVMLVVTTTLFFVTRIVSDPASQFLGIDATPDSLAALRHNLGLDRSLIDQFVRFVRDAVRLDFGESLWRRKPAMELVGTALPNTIQLVTWSTVVAVLVAVPCGVLAALKPGGLLDRAIVGVSLVGVSLPQFWLGAILILVFAVNMKLVPTSGQGTWQQLVLPAATLAAPNIGGIAQLTRSAFIQELRAPYVASARAKGLSQAYIVARHALRNAAVPIVTMVTYQLAAALAGQTVVVETVFAWPGVGRLAIEAVQQQDLPLLQAIVFSIAFLVVAINIVADIVYRLIDPRIEARVGEAA